MAGTLRDVAERVGCSVATVSRFVNGTAPLALETRNRIEAAIAELGYRPSEIGRSLKRKATRTLGVLVPSLTNPVFGASVAGFQSAARAAGYTVLIATSDYDCQTEVRAVETFLGQSVDGLALTVCDAMASPALAIVDASAKPNVLIYNLADRHDRAALTVDSREAAFEMTGQVLARGHERIAFLAGRFSTSDRSRSRYRGFAEAMAQAGLAPPQPVEMDYLDERPDALVSRLIADDERPTALICSNDMLALAVIGALKRAGARVPEDMSVAGFDGISLGQMVEPTLASVWQPAQLMGERACEELLACLGGRQPGPLPLLPHEIRLGGSLGPVPADPRAIPASTAPAVSPFTPLVPQEKTR